MRRRPLPQPCRLRRRPPPPQLPDRGWRSPSTRRVPPGLAVSLDNHRPSAPRRLPRPLRTPSTPSHQPPPSHLLLAAGLAPPWPLQAEGPQASSPVQDGPIPPAFPWLPAAGAGRSGSAPDLQERRCPGDIESMPFIEAKINFHIVLKTKPTKHSVRGLRGLGLPPDVLACCSTEVNTAMAGKYTSLSDSYMSVLKVKQRFCILHL